MVAMNRPPTLIYHWLCSKCGWKVHTATSPAALWTERGDTNYCGGCGRRLTEAPRVNEIRTEWRWPDRIDVDAIKGGRIGCKGGVSNFATLMYCYHSDICMRHEEPDGHNVAVVVSVDGLGQRTYVCAACVMEVYEEERAWWSQPTDQQDSGPSPT